MGKRINSAVWFDKYSRWQIKVQKDGERRTFTSATPGRTGQREANKKADEWLDDGIVGASVRASVLYGKWIEELKTSTGRGHWTIYQGFWKNWISKKLLSTRVGDITEQHLQDVITAGSKAGLSKKTLSNLRACMTAFIKYARKCKASTLLVEHVTIPRNAPVGERSILQPVDIIKLFNIDYVTLYHKKVYDLYVNAFRFEVVTGLRPGEVIGLQWDDVGDGIVTLKRSINKYNEQTRGKNDNARRSFALTPIAQDILDKQKAKLAELRIDTEIVFPNELGVHIKQRTYHKRWVRYSASNGISKASPYELRHTFVSAVKQLPEGFLKMLVGHSKDMDTYGVYSHIVSGDMEKAAELVQQTFLAILKTPAGKEVG